MNFLVLTASSDSCLSNEEGMQQFGMLARCNLIFCLCLSLVNSSLGGGVLGVAVSTTWTIVCSWWLPYSSTSWRRRRVLTDLMVAVATWLYPAGDHCTLQPPGGGWEYSSTSWRRWRWWLGTFSMTRPASWYALAEVVAEMHLYASQARVNHVTSAVPALMIAAWWLLASSAVRFLFPIAATRNVVCGGGVECTSCNAAAGSPADNPHPWPLVQLGS